MKPLQGNLDFFLIRASRAPFRLKHKTSSPAPQFESINSLVLSFIYGPTLTSIRDYWKNYSFDHMDFCRLSVKLL